VCYFLCLGRTISLGSTTIATTQTVGDLPRFNARAATRVAKSNPAQSANATLMVDVPLNFSPTYFRTAASALYSCLQRSVYFKF
jgi:hypothetical protein